jgi:hypothetical protein
LVDFDRCFLGLKKVEQRYQEVNSSREKLFGATLAVQKDLQRKKSLLKCVQNFAVFCILLSVRGDADMPRAHIGIVSIETDVEHPRRAGLDL